MSRKIAMIGAGSVVFCKTLISDILATPALVDTEFALMSPTETKLRRMEASRLRHRIDELLEHFELLNWQDELVEGFSHGMKQRLVLCAALVHEPRILIIDEPMVGLDPKGARTIKDLFRSLAKTGTTVFLSTHSISVAEEVCHRIGIIQKGRLIASGTMADLYRLTQADDSNLEDVFLELTQQQSDSSILGRERQL